jgi:hypothetical protein
MATSLEPKPVFYSERVQPAIPDRAFVPMQDPNEVDELVYSAPNASQPRICIVLSHKHKPLLFPGYVARTSVNMLVDSGATVSFASSQWCACTPFIMKIVHYMVTWPTEQFFKFMAS